MIKKLTMLAMAVGALVAFAVPAAASATPLLHNEAGEAVNHVTAVSENTISMTGLGELECTTVELTITATENTTTTAHGSGEGAAFGTPPNGHGREEPCLGSTGDVVISRVAVNTIHLNSNGTGHASFEFDIASPVECTVDGTADISFTPGSDELSLVNGTLEGTGAGVLCPFLDGSITGDFTLQNGVTAG